MDVLAGFLDGPRARGAFLLRAVMDPPWSIRIQDEAPLSVIAVLGGAATYVPDDDPPVALRPGDVAVVLGPEPYTVADEVGTAPQIVCRPGQRCTTPDGRDLHDVLDLGVRTWGTATGAPGATSMLVGTYEHRTELGQRLLDVLPRAFVLRAASWSSPFVPLLAGEVQRDDPGQAAVLDRLLDLLLVDVLRAWFSRPEAAAPAWYRAAGDPVVGPALRAVLADPARPWTVASLAAEVGASRAAFARRFSEVLGEPPMAFLTGWRLALAADLLREPDATVGAVARQVGYGSPFSLSAAFKRVRGMSPREHRERAGVGRPDATG